MNATDGARMSAWEIVNSRVFMWLVGTVLIGGFVWLFEGYRQSRNELSELNRRFDQLAFEYDGRLSQFSEWFIQQLEDPTNFIEPEFGPCVSLEVLRDTIRLLAGPPGKEYGAPKCSRALKINEILVEFKDYSTVSLISEMLFVHEELLQRGESRPVRVPVVDCKDVEDSESFSDRLLVSINSLINPDAVIPYGETIDVYSMEKLRGRFMCAFYGIGPEVFWYTDVFAY